MTDFLTSLVERSFGTTGVIRPRVASLFEPLRNRAPHSDDVAEPREAGLSREEKPDSDVRHQPVEKHPAFALWDNRVGSPEVARTADGVPARAVPLPQEDSAPRPASVPADAALVQKNAFAALGFAPGLDSRRDSAPREQYPDGALAFPAAHSEAEAGVVRDASASPVVSPPSSKIAEGVVENVVENNERGLLVATKVSAEMAAEMRNYVSAMGAQPGKRLTDQLESSTADLLAHSEPTIQVTIGRIEVRATSEGTTPGRLRPASPVMNLDEYLRHRARRGGQ